MKRSLELAGEVAVRVSEDQLVNIKMFVELVQKLQEAVQRPDRELVRLYGGCSISASMRLNCQLQSKTRRLVAMPSRSWRLKDGPW